MTAERGATARDPGVMQVDPREVAEGFRRLHPDVQTVVREGWKRNDLLDEQVERRARSQRKRDMLEAFAIVGFTELCLYGFDVTHLLAAAAVSALIGEAWWRCRAGQIATPLIAVLGSVTLQAMWICTSQTNLFTLSCTSAFIGFVCAYAGVRREQRSTE